MTLPWETVHIFISSTFNDMHAERDYLVKQVFPELREWCEKRKLRLVDIDLRWGVTEQDATSQNVVKVCLDRIDDCRPFFLCFLGQRRGWVPKEEEISPSTKTDFPALKDYAGKASVTEMEILHALVNPLHRGRVRDPKKPGEFYEPSKYAFFYLREDSYLDQLPVDPPQIRETYTNEGVENIEDRVLQKKELYQWREEKIPNTGRPVRYYQAKWNKNLSTPELLFPLKCPSTKEKAVLDWQKAWRKAGVTVTDVDVEADPSQAEKAHGFNKLISTGRLTDFQADSQPLNQVIVADLQAAIAARFPDHTEVVGETDLQKELDQQEQFLYSGSQGFIERGGDFDDLDDYVHNDSNQLFVLTAPGGLGKSSLLATWVDRYRTIIERQTGESIHFRFIGQSDRSTTVYSLLNLLLHELKEVAGKISEEIPGDPQKLRQEFLKHLESAGEKGKTVIVMDAINQLESGLSDLAWLPYRLPHNIKLIISFKRGESEAENLLKHLQEQAVLSEVRPFENPEHRKQLVDKYLDQYLKQLDLPLKEALIQSPGASNPLYLKVVLSELRVFGAFANLGEKIRTDFGQTPLTAFEAVLRRLETDPAYSSIDPQKGVPLLFGLLAHARQGLSVDELGSLYIQALKLKGDEPSCQAVKDTVNLFLRQVRPFLARRDGRYDFFFESFKNATLMRYVGVQDQKRTTEEWHHILAEYFSRMPTWQLFTERKPTLRKTAELVYQQLMGKMWLDLYTTLTDFQFLEARCRSSSVYDLETDYRLALSDWQGQTEHMNILADFEERFRLESHLIHRHPEMLFSRMYNNLTWLDKEQNGPIHTICELARTEQFNWLRMTQDPRPAPPRWLKSFEGHKRVVNALGLTPDGSRVISSSEDNTIKIWDLAGGKLLRSLYGHSAGGILVAVTQNGRQVIPGVGDPGIKLWDLESGQPLRSFGDAYNDLKLTPDSQKFITLANDKSIKVWDSENGRLLRTIEGSNQTLTLTPDGQQVICGLGDGTIRIWDLNNGQLINSILGHTAAISSLKATPDGKRLISQSLDQTLKVWDLQTGQLLHTHEGHISRVNALAITPDSQRFISSPDAKSLKVWDLETGLLFHSLEGYTDEIQCVAVTPDGRKIISGSEKSYKPAPEDNSLRVWDIESGQLLHTLTGHMGGIRVIAITPDSKQVISGSVDMSIKVWDLESGQVLTLLEGHSSYISAVVQTPDGRKIVSGSGDKTIKVWDLANGRLLQSLAGHKSEIDTIVLTPNGNHIISGSLDNTMNIWDLESGRLLISLKGRKVAVTPDSTKVISGSTDKTINVWDLGSGQLLHSLQGHTNEIMSIAVTPDGQRIVSEASEIILKVWDLKSRQPMRSIPSLSQYVKGIFPTIDGRQIIFGSDGNDIKVWDLESGQLLITLVGHTRSISAITVTPDGRQVVSGAENWVLKVWNLVNGQLVHTFEGHTGAISALVVTPDNKRVISASWDKTIKMWNLESGQLVHSFEGHTGVISALVVTPDNKRVISASWEGPIKMWDRESGQLLRTLEGHNRRVSALVVTSDGHRVISGSFDKTIKLWDLESGLLLHTFEGHNDHINSLAVTPDGQQVISGSSDATIKVWDLASGNLINTLQGHSGDVFVLAVTLDGQQVVSGSSGKILRVWDLESGRLLRWLEGLNRNISTLVTSQEGRQLIFGADDKSIMVWDLETRQILSTLEGHDDDVRAIMVTPDGRKVVSASKDNSIKVWDMDSKQLIHTFEVQGVSSLAVTPDSQQVISGSEDQTIKVWDLENIQQPRSLEGHTGLVNSVALTPDGQRVISEAGEMALKVWNMDGGQLLRSLKGHTSSARCVAVTADGQFVISGSENGPIKVWDLESGRLLRSLTGHMDEIQALAVTPDGQQVFSGSLDKTLRVWDLESGQMIRTLQGFSDATAAIVLTMDARNVISGSGNKYMPNSGDKTIKVLDMDNGQLLCTLVGHTDFVESLAVTPDDRQIISGSGDKTIKVWSLETGKLLRSLEGHTMSVSSVAVTPDAKQVVSASLDKTIKVWNLESGQSTTLFINGAEINNLSLSPDGCWLACGDRFGQVLLFEWIHDPTVDRKNIPQQPHAHQPDLPTMEKLATQAYVAREYEKSLNYFELALVQVPDDLNLLSFSVAALLKLNRYQEALDRIDHILAHDLATGVNLGLMYLGKGNALQGLRRYEEASAWYPKAIELAGNYSSVWYMQGCNLFNLNRYEQALESFQHALAMNSDVNTRLYMGYCLMHLDRPTEAEAVYEELVAEGMGNATVYFSLAAAEKVLGKHTEERSNLELFMKIATSEPQSMMLKAKQRLEELSE
ncbi:MAG: hypothetical protein A2Y53_06425 [Chloroflexi bacterium RBG_16_47_49]|nr:MAG: hypothetical protein A2Y53_06425 [Chloroflexi bacterium RBG_16_47_49]